MVANPGRGQLNSGNDFFPVPVRAWEFGLARQVRPSPSRASLLILHAQTESGAYSRNFSRFPPRHLHVPPTAIGSVPSLSGYALTYRWRPLPRVHRQRPSSPQGSFPNECYLFRFNHGPFFFSGSLFPHPLVSVWDIIYSRLFLDCDFERLSLTSNTLKKGRKNVYATTTTDNTVADQYCTSHWSSKKALRPTLNSSYLPDIGSTKFSLRHGR